MGKVESHHRTGRGEGKVWDEMSECECRLCRRVLCLPSACRRMRSLSSCCRPSRTYNTKTSPSLFAMSTAFDEVGSLFVSNSNPMMSSTGMATDGKQLPSSVTRLIKNPYNSDRVLTNGNPCLSFAASSSTGRRNSSTADSGLFSHETLDRSSPDLWPEQSE